MSDRCTLPPSAPTSIAASVVRRPSAISHQSERSVDAAVDTGEPRSRGQVGEIEVLDAYATFERGCVTRKRVRPQPFDQDNPLRDGDGQRGGGGDLVCAHDERKVDGSDHGIAERGVADAKLTGRGFGVARAAGTQRDRQIQGDSFPV